MVAELVLVELALELLVGDGGSVGARALGALADASNTTFWFSTAAEGVIVNAGLRPSGGMTIPGGTSRIDAVRLLELLKSEPTGVMAISTTVPSSTATLGAAGAVYTSVARPSAPVTRLRAESEPKSARTPPT